MIRNFNGTFQRIWFPDGPPNYLAETEGLPSDYEGPDGQRALEQWKFFMEKGTFEGGVMPEVAPKREFCAWDF